MIIAIDFDGTIAKTHYPEIIEPIPGAIKTIKELYDKGHILIIWTLRDGENLESALRWLAFKGIDYCFTYVNCNVDAEIKKWNSDPRKVAADMYIDDRAIGWQGWHQVRQLFCLD